MRFEQTILAFLASFVLSMLGSGQTGITGRTVRGTIGSRPEPARLSVDLKLNTPSETGLLFENETASLSLIVMNEGGLPAERVIARMKFPREAEGLILDSTLFIGRIAPEDTVQVNHPIGTTVIRSRQDVAVIVEVSDSAGFLVRQPLVLSLEKSNSISGNADIGTVGQELNQQQQLANIFSVARNWLLVIGINQYVHWPILQTPVADAKEVKRVLMNRYGFESRYVIELYDGNATRSEIIRNLEYLARVVRPEDNLLIYYGGHGFHDKLLNRGYWIPVNAEPESSSDYLPNTELYAFIAAIRSRATLVISDACFSGVLFRGGFQEAQNERYILEVSKLKARQVLISGGNEPVMDSGISSEHSVFAYYLIDRLKTNQARYMTAGSLFEDIKVPVSNNSLQTPQCKPISNTGDEGGQYVFVRRR
jgi:hypothetical protein